MPDKETREERLTVRCHLWLPPTYRPFPTTCLWAPVAPPARRGRPVCCF